MSFYYFEGVDHDTLFCADEGTDPETAAVHRLIYNFHPSFCLRNAIQITAPYTKACFNTASIFRITFN